MLSLTENKLFRIHLACVMHCGWFWKFWHPLFCLHCSWEPYFSQPLYRLDKMTMESLRHCCGAVSNMKLSFKNSEGLNMMSSPWIMLMLYCIILTNTTSRLVGEIWPRKIKVETERKMFYKNSCMWDFLFTKI